MPPVSMTSELGVKHSVRSVGGVLLIDVAAVLLVSVLVPHVAETLETIILDASRILTSPS